MDVQVDPWRMYQLLRTTSDPSHPFSKFGTGNLKTLKEEPESKGIDTRAGLLDFHKRYYSVSPRAGCAHSAFPRLPPALACTLWLSPSLIAPVAYDCWSSLRRPTRWDWC